eukprot:scaffold10054_cov140-Cylindrotheca_fusiformis.AAC.9
MKAAVRDAGSNQRWRKEVANSAYRFHLCRKVSQWIVQTTGGDILPSMKQIDHDCCNHTMPSFLCSGECGQNQKLLDEENCKCEERYTIMELLVESRNWREMYNDLDGRIRTVAAGKPRIYKLEGNVR